MVATPRNSVLCHANEKTYLLLKTYLGLHFSHFRPVLRFLGFAPHLHSPLPLYFHPPLAQSKLPQILIILSALVYRLSNFPCRLAPISLLPLLILFLPRLPYPPAVFSVRCLSPQTRALERILVIPGVFLE